MGTCNILRRELGQQIEYILPVDRSSAHIFSR